MSSHYRSRTYKTKENYYKLLSMIGAVIVMIFGLKGLEDHLDTKVVEADTKSQEVTHLTLTTTLPTQIVKPLKSTIKLTAKPAAKEETPVVTQLASETAASNLDFQTVAEYIPTEQVTYAVDTVYTSAVAASVTTTTTAANFTGQLANGNTAGAIGTEAAAKMAEATGVSQSTWEYIIARESNGDPTVANASGASGLFQTMPGWGSTATVEDQINTAIKAYNSQGLSAWGIQ